MKMYKKSGNPPQEDLAKYGYIQDMKYKTTYIHTYIQGTLLKRIKVCCIVQEYVF